MIDRLGDHEDNSPPTVAARRLTVETLATLARPSASGPRARYGRHAHDPAPLRVASVRDEKAAPRPCAPASGGRAVAVATVPDVGARVVERAPRRERAFHVEAPAHPYVGAHGD